MIKIKYYSCTWFILFHSILIELHFVHAFFLSEFSALKVFEITDLDNVFRLLKRTAFFNLHGECDVFTFSPSLHLGKNLKL